MSETERTPSASEGEDAPGSSRWLPVAFFAVLVGLAVLWAGVSSETRPPPAETGAPAPDFRLPSLEGEPVALSDHRGRVVLINFWATWCGPCEDEMPAMERLYRELAPQGFELLAVSVDEERSDVEAFQERLGLTFPILLDPDQDAAERYHSARYPESFLIDADGVLVARYIGPREWDDAAYVGRIRRLIEADLAPEAASDADR